MKTLYRGGHVLSAAHIGPGLSLSTALLVDGEDVAWVGSDAAAGGLLTGPDGDDLAVVELDGAVVTPGFVDAHVHVTETGLVLTGVDLRSARSVTELLDLVEVAARSGGGRPVRGHGWDERRLAEGRPPTRRELDRASAGGVVYLSRIDLHSAIVSSALAAAAGLAELDGWDEDGRVERDAHHAARATTRAVLTAGDRRVAQVAALRAAAAVGITGLHEMSAPHLAPEADLLDLLALATDPAERLPEVVGYRGELVADVSQAQAVATRLGAAELGPAGSSAGHAAGHVAGHIAGLAGDLCVDGSVGSRTAAFRDPYLDAPGHRGHTYLDAEQVRDHVAACTRAGLQAGFHVIGDAGLDIALDGLRRAAERVGIAAVRRAGHRLEHVENADAEAVAELADLGVTVSMQPAFEATWGGPGGMYAARLGQARALAMNAFGALDAAGVPLAFGSDSPVTPFDPWGAVRACTEHHSAGLRLSAADALLHHTRGGLQAARGGPTDPRVGLLTPGAPATFAIWRAADLDPGAPGSGAQDAAAVLVEALAREHPTCVRSVRCGLTLHDATEQSTAQPTSASSSPAGRSL